MHLHGGNFKFCHGIMAAGKPVIVTDGGGSSELVADGVTGFLVPPFTGGAVAEKIELLLDDSEKARQMGLAGRKRLERQFSLEKLAETSLQMYRDVRTGARSTLPQHCPQLD